MVEQKVKQEHQPEVDVEHRKVEIEKEQEGKEETEYKEKDDTGNDWILL